MVHLVVVGDFIALEEQERFDAAFSAPDGTPETRVRTKDLRLPGTPFVNDPTVTYPCLVGLWGVYAGDGFRFRADRPYMTIGRETSCDVALPFDHSVSRLHAVISPTTQGFLLRDRNSTNGTFVNGKRVLEALLTFGDEIAVGQSAFRLAAVTARWELAHELLGGQRAAA